MIPCGKDTAALGQRPASPGPAPVGTGMAGGNTGTTSATKRSGAIMQVALGFIRLLGTVALRGDLTTLHAVENDPHSQVSEIGDLVFGACADK